MNMMAFRNSSKYAPMYSLTTNNQCSINYNISKYMFRKPGIMSLSVHCQKPRLQSLHNEAIPAIIQQLLDMTNLFNKTRDQLLTCLCRRGQLPLGNFKCWPSLATMKIIQHNATLQDINILSQADIILIQMYTYHLCIAYYTYLVVIGSNKEALCKL